MSTKIENISAEPGVYEIHNIHNNQRYYGESKNVLLRMGQHIINLHKPKTTKDLQKYVNLFLYEDWWRWGASSFIFQGLVYGIEMHDVRTRREKEKEFIRANASLAYNTLGNTQERHSRIQQAAKNGTTPPIDYRALQTQYNQHSQNYIQELGAASSVDQPKNVKSPSQYTEGLPNQFPTRNSMEGQFPTRNSMEGQFPRKKSKGEVSKIGAEASKKVTEVKTIIDGREFKSTRNAAEVLKSEGVKISAATISKRARDPKFPTYGFLDKNNNFTKVSQKTLPMVEIDGNQYEGVTNAAKQQNVPVHTVRNRIKRSGEGYDRWKRL